MTTPNDDLAAKIAVDKMTPRQAYEQAWGSYEGKSPVDITKTPDPPVTNAPPFGPLK